MTYHRSPKRDDSKTAAPAISTPKQATPDKPGEAMQRYINRTSHHSERVTHGGQPGSGKARGR